MLMLIREICFSGSRSFARVILLFRVVIGVRPVLFFDMRPQRGRVSCAKQSKSPNVFLSVLPAVALIFGLGVTVV